MTFHRLYFRLSLLIITLTSTMYIGCATPNPASRSELLEKEIDEVLAAWDSATVAITIIDPQTGVHINRNEDRLFHAASTMKVPVMIELYRWIEDGRMALDDELVVRNEFHSIVDGSTYAIGDDSDEMIYDRLGQTMTVRELIRRMITVSSNLATNLLIETVSADSVQATSRRLGTTRMQTLRGVEDLKAYEQGLSNRTTSRDLATLMDALRRGEAVSSAADSAMREILFAQTFSAMIPSGLPRTARVAHKTGQITEIHHDAAIVYPESDDPYVIVILIEGLVDDANSSELGSSLSRIVYRSLRGED